MRLSLPGPVLLGNLLPAAADRLDLVFRQWACLDQLRVLFAARGVLGANDSGMNRLRECEAKGNGSGIRPAQKIVIQLAEPCPVGLMISISRKLNMPPGG